MLAAEGDESRRSRRRSSARRRRSSTIYYAGPSRSTTALASREDDAVARTPFVEALQQQEGKRKSIESFYGGVRGRARMASLVDSREDKTPEVPPAVAVRPPLRREGDAPLHHHLTIADIGNFVGEEPETHADVSYTDWVARLGSYKAAARQLRSNAEARVEHKEWSSRKQEYDIFMKREERRELERRWTRGSPRLPRSVAEAAHIQRLKKLERLELRMSQDKDVDVLVRQAPFTDRLDLQGKLVDNNVDLFARLLEDDRVLRVIEMRVARNGLRSLPEGLHLRLSRLRILDLSQNRLESLPGGFALLRSLKELNLQYNKFQDLPLDAYELPALEILTAGGNTFLDLHYRVAQAKALREFSLDNNRLVTLPLALSELDKCERLNLNHNALETLALFPPAAYACMTAEELQEDMKHWKRVELPAKGESGYIHEITGHGRRTLEPLHEQLRLDEDPELADFDVSGDKIVAAFIAGVDPPPYQVPATAEKPLSGALVAPLDLGKLDNKTQIGKLRAKQRIAIARAGKMEWRYWVNDNTGATEFGNIVTLEVVRQGIPPSLDRWNTLVGLRELLLNCNQLTELPASLGKLPRLERLEACQNRIVFIPEAITYLPQLAVLALRENRIETLPEAMGRLKNLEKLELSGNRLISVPRSLRACCKLEVLDLTTNCLVELCADIGALSQLKVLALTDNPNLLHPPPEAVRRGRDAILWDCRNREKLRALGAPPPATRREDVGVAGEHHVVEGMYHKKVAQAMERARQTGILKMHFFGLRAIPDQAFGLRKLRELRISGHKAITTLPKHLSRLRLLRVLSFSANALCEIPESLAFWSAFEELAEIDLCDNKLEAVPAALSVLPKLKLLSLKGNRLSSLDGSCFKGKLALALERLYLSSNRLQSLPGEVNQLTRLRVLELTYNQIESLPVELGGLQGLERLHLSRNKLRELPDSLGTLERLKVLQVACNQLERVQPALFQGALRQSLEVLNVQVNQLPELPPALCEMQTLQQIVFDANPMSSPPVNFHGQAWAVKEVLAYCEERQRRLGLLVDKLRASIARDDHFALDESRLMPVCRGALVDKHCYLAAGDTEDIDATVDRFMNGAFYDAEESVFDTVKRIEDIFDRQRNAKLRIVLDDLLKLVEIGQEYDLLSERDFTNDLRIGFGRNNEPVKSYALRLSALYRETNEDADADAGEGGDDSDDEVNSLSSLESFGNENAWSDSNEDDDEDDDDNLSEAGRAPNLIQAVSLLRREHQFNFEHSQELLELALRTYRGPYGRIAWMRAPWSFEDMALAYPEYIEVVVDSSEGGGRPNPNKRQHGTRNLFAKEAKVATSSSKWFAVARAKLAALWRPLSPDYMPETRTEYTFEDSRREEHSDIIVFAQLFYSLEEAARRHKEDAELARVSRCTVETFESWCEIVEGKERLSSVAVDRIGRAAEIFEKLRDDYHDAKENLEMAQEHLQEAERRVRMFENGEPEHLHHVKSKKKGLKLIREAEEEVEECRPLAQELEEKFTLAKGRKKLRLKQVIESTRDEVAAVIRARARVLKMHEFRMRALRQELRRPWDGDNGRDFEVWKLARKRAMVDLGVEDVNAFVSEEDAEDLPPEDIVHIIGDAFAYDAYFDMLDSLDDDA